MITIRKGTFETNSSSCHCFCIMDDAEYNEFLVGNRIILTGLEESFSLEEFADYLLENARYINAWAEDTRDRWTEDFDAFMKDIDYMADAGLSKEEQLQKDMFDEAGRFTESFKKWYKWETYGDLKVSTWDEYIRELEANHEYCQLPDKNHIIELLEICYSQHAYCDDHMGGYGVSDIKGLTKEDENFFYLADRNCYMEDGFVIGLKGLENCPKDGPYSIKKINNHAYEIEYDTFG